MHVALTKHQKAIFSRFLCRSFIILDSTLRLLKLASWLPLCQPVYYMSSLLSLSGFVSLNQVVQVLATASAQAQVDAWSSFCLLVTYLLALSMCNTCFSYFLVWAPHTLKPFLFDIIFWSWNHPWVQYLKFTQHLFSIWFQLPIFSCRLCIHPTIQAGITMISKSYSWHQLSLYCTAEFIILR